MDGKLTNENVTEETEVKDSAEIKFVNLRSYFIRDSRYQVFVQPKLVKYLDNIIIIDIIITNIITTL